MAVRRRPHALLPASRDAPSYSSPCNTSEEASGFRHHSSPMCHYDHQAEEPLKPARCCISSLVRHHPPHATATASPGIRTPRTTHTARSFMHALAALHDTEPTEGTLQNPRTRMAQAEQAAQEALHQDDHRERAAPQAAHATPHAGEVATASTLQGNDGDDTTGEATTLVPAPRPLDSLCCTQLGCHLLGAGSSGCSGELAGLRRVHSWWFGQPRENAVPRFLPERAGA